MRDLERLMEHVLASGRINVDDPEATAAVLLASLTYFPQGMIGRTPGDLEADRYLDAWVHHALRSLGIDDGKLYVQTGGWKVRRIAHNQSVRVAPSTFRGRPLGPPLEATARILGPPERRIAEGVFMAKLGPVLRIYHSTLGRAQRQLSQFLEITPTRSDG